MKLHILMDTVLFFCFVRYKDPSQNLLILRRVSSPFAALSPIGPHCVPMGLNLSGVRFFTISIQLSAVRPPATEASAGPSKAASGCSFSARI